LAAQVAPLPVPQRWLLALHVNPQVPPDEHVAVPPVTAGHWVAHAPQCFGSVCSFTHEAPHRLSPVAHPDVQSKGSALLPVGEQYGNPAVHAVEHPPQCAGSLITVSQPLSGSVEQIP